MNEADRHGTRDSERDPTDWVGRERVEHDILTLFPARGMAALLDRSPKEMGDGSVLPPGWHWLYFRPVVEQRHLGGDGHERLGDFLRPVPLSRRMWAGGKLSLLDELRLGDAVTRRSRVESAVEKQGRSGAPVFRDCPPRPLHRAGSGGGGGAAPRVPRRGRRPPSTGGSGGAERMRLEREVLVRHGHAFSLLCAHLQRSPHPLRSPVRGRSGGLSGARRARPAHGSSASRCGDASRRSAGADGLRVPRHQSALRRGGDPHRR